MKKKYTLSFALLKTNDGVASFSIIKNLYELEKNAATKACPKLTKTHVEPNTFAKMRVSYAVQILSNSVASAINTSIFLESIPQCQINKAKTTSSFVKNFNDVFDFFNSSVNDKNTMKGNLEQVKFLEDMKIYISGLTLIPRPNEKKKTVYALSGWINNINALLMFSKEIFFDFPNVDSIATRRLNQDILENVFSIIRSRGNNRNPSAKEFNYILRFIINMKTVLPQLKNPKSNCCIDQDLEAHFETEPISNSDIQIINDTEDNTEICMEDDFDDQEDDYEEITLEENAANYFVGYVSTKMKNNINCLVCEEKMIKGDSLLPEFSDEINFLLNEKQNSSRSQKIYNVPTSEFFKVCWHQILFFKENFKNKIHIIKLKEYFKTMCIAITNKRFPNWFLQSDPCCDHRLKTLDFLLLILIRKHCKWIKDTQKNYKHKLSILNS